MSYHVKVVDSAHVSVVVFLDGQSQHNTLPKCSISAASMSAAKVQCTRMRSVMITIQCTAPHEALRQDCICHCLPHSAAYQLQATRDVRMKCLMDILVQRCGNAAAPSVVNLSGWAAVKLRSLEESQVHVCASLLPYHPHNKQFTGSAKRCSRPDVLLATFQGHSRLDV